MPFLPRSTGYLFLALFTLSVAVGGAGAVYALVCAGQAALLVLVARRRRPSVPDRSVVLAAAVLAYAPAAVAGTSAPNLDCLLAATLLRCTRGRSRPLAFAVVAAASGVVREGGPYAVLSTAAIGAVVHILLRLPETVTRLDATRDELARAAVTAERLRVAHRLQAALGDRLVDVMDLLRRARASLGAHPHAARAAVTDAGRTVRTMIEEVRSTAATVHEDEPPAVGPGREGRFVQTLVLAALGVSLFAWTARLTLEATRFQPAVAVGGAVMSALFLAQLLLPRRALPLLALQAGVTLLPLPWLGVHWCMWLILLAAAVLLQERAGWPVPAALALVALRAAYPERPYPAAGGVGWMILAAEAVLVLFGLARFQQLSSELNRSRAELVATSLEIERGRLSRDIHDLLGLSLSVLALKSDLIAELAARRPDRAREELDESLRIAARARAEARSALDGHPSAALPHELAVTREILTREGVDVRVTGDEELPGAALLVPVLREAVTNVLRHSEATRVDIGFRRDGDVLHMGVRNDGVRGPAADAGGRGLRNMRSRLDDAGGGLTVSATGGTFLVTARLPLDGAAGGADRTSRQGPDAHASGVRAHYPRRGTAARLPRAGGGTDLPPEPTEAEEHTHARRQDSPLPRRP